MSARTKLLTGAIRTRLLTFDPTGSDGPLSLAGGLHTLAAPDNAAYPYGLLRLKAQRTGREDGDSSIEGRLEVMLVGRGRAQLGPLEDAMDIVTEALAKWSTDTVGWLTMRDLENRLTLPPFPQPANAEIVQVHATWRYTWWPEYLMQYRTANGSSST